LDIKNSTESFDDYFLVQEEEEEEKMQIIVCYKWLSMFEDIHNKLIQSEMEFLS
jgi:hypothetical protein